MTAIETNKETYWQTIISIWLPAYIPLKWERNLWGVVHLLKYSLILSLETFSGRFPTHRWRVSLTIAPANHRCWHPGGLNHPLTSLSSTWPLVSTPHTLSHKQAPAVTDVRPRLPCRLPGGRSARTGLSPLLLALPAVDTNADFSHKNFTLFEFLSFTAHNDFCSLTLADHFTCSRFWVFHLDKRRSDVKLAAFRASSTAVGLAAQPPGYSWHWIWKKGEIRRGFVIFFRKATQYTWYFRKVSMSRWTTFKLIVFLLIPPLLFQLPVFFRWICPTELVVVIFY